MSPKLLNLLLVVASFAVYYLIINPLYSGIGSIWQPERGITALRTLNAQYDSTLAQADSLFKQADDLKRQYNALDGDSKAKMEIMVPNSIDALRLLNEISAIAAASGVLPGSISYADMPQASKLAGVYQISFTVKTTYPKFKEFMRNYENSLRLFTIQSISFSAPDKEKGDDLTTFQVKLNTYYLK